MKSAAFSVAAGVVRAEQPGEGTSAVVGAHPDGMGDQIGFGLKESAAGSYLPQWYVVGGGS